MHDTHRNARGRYAPSPTGKLHVGNARTALVAWLSIRSKAGSFVLRVEDLDGPRVVPGMSKLAEQDLQWLGIDWDEGPDGTGEFGPYKQSMRTDVYENALNALESHSFLFPCSYSRKDLASLASAPHGPNRNIPYPKSLRPADLEDNWFKIYRSDNPGANLRFKTSGKPVYFNDLIMGPQSENVQEAVGDFVVKRRDGMYAYQLAVVVDDLAMGITEVVRGVDLLASTARQIQLIEALRGTPPVYAHVPLVLNDAGEKLSKRDEALTLSALRERGVAPEQLIGSFLFSLGLTSSPRASTARAAVPLFDWKLMGRSDWVLPPNYADKVKEIPL